MNRFFSRNDVEQKWEFVSCEFCNSIAIFKGRYPNFLGSEMKMIKGV